MAVRFCSGKTVGGLDKYDVMLLSIVGLACLSYMLTVNVLLITLLQFALIIKAIFFRGSHNKSLKEIVAALFMGAEIALFLFSILYLISSVIYKSNAFFRKRNLVILILFVYSFYVFIINSISEFLPLNYVLWLMIFFGGFAIYLYAQELHEKGASFYDLKSFFAILIGLQFFVLLIQGAMAWSYAPGDWAMGTFIDAHKIGFVLMFFIAYLSFNFLEKPSVMAASIIIISFLFLYMCDAKAILLSGILAIVLILLFSILNFQVGRKLINRISAVFSLVGLILAITIISLYSAYGDVWGDFLDIYAYGSLTSSKYQMYGKVWGNMLYENPFSWLVGVGPGELASKASNMLSGDVLWKGGGGWMNLLPLFSSNWTKVYMAGLYDYDVAAMIPNVSAVLAYPFAGFISIKAELGFVGFILYSYVMFRILVNSLSGINTPLDRTLIFMGCTLYASLLFDNYHEQIPIMGLYMLILGLNTKKMYKRELS